jgi:membrane-associated HD superfamily phosphohydrolase
MSTTADAFKTFTPVTGTYSWSKVVQQKPPPVSSEVTTKPNSAATLTTASLATSAFTPNHTSDIQALREEYEEKQKSLHDKYEEKQRSTTNEIAELKNMLQQFIHTLHLLGVQGAVSSTPSTDPQSESETQSTGETENMEIFINKTAQMVTPKRNGTISPSGNAPGRQKKRPNHKPSPRKKDFRKDE